MDRGAFEVAAAALTAGSSVPYLVAIRRRSVRPQRMSWFVFAALSATAAAVQMRSGSSAGAWLAVGSVVGFGAIFGYSMRWGEGGWHWPDRCTLLIAGAGAALLVFDRPLAALLTVVAAEIAATALTVHKVWASPADEARTTWSIDALAGAVALAGLARWRFDSVLYPAHHIAVNLWVVVAVTRGRTRPTAAVSS